MRNSRFPTTPREASNTPGPSSSQPRAARPTPSSPAATIARPSPRQSTATSSRAPLPQQQTATTTTAPLTSANSHSCPCPVCSNSRAMQTSFNARLAAEPPLTRCPFLTDAALSSYNLYLSDVSRHNSNVHATIISGYHSSQISKDLALYYNAAAYTAQLQNESVYRSFFKEHGDAQKAVGQLIRLLKPVGRTVEEHVGRFGGKFHGELITNGQFMTLKGREFRSGYNVRDSSTTGTPRGNPAGTTTGTTTPTVQVGNKPAQQTVEMEKEGERSGGNKTNQKENVKGKHKDDNIPPTTMHDAKNMKRKHSSTTTTTVANTSSKNASLSSPNEQISPTTTRKPSKKHKTTHHSSTIPTPASTKSRKPSSSSTSSSVPVRVPSPHPVPAGTINPRKQPLLLSKSTQRGEGEREYIDETRGNGGSSRSGLATFMGSYDDDDDNDEELFKAVTCDDIRGILVGSSRQYVDGEGDKVEKGKRMMEGMWGLEEGGDMWKVQQVGVGVGGVGWY